RVLLPRPVGPLGHRQPVHRLPRRRPAECAQVVQLGEPEAGGVDGGHPLILPPRPSGVADLAGLDDLEHGRIRVGAGAQVRQPGPVHLVPVGHHVPAGGVQVDLPGRRHERSVRPQYVGSEGSTCLTQASTPPCRWTASRNPAALTVASASAERTPDLQYSTICRSWGSSASASPDRIRSFGMSTLSGIRTISYSAGSRTSTSSTSLPACCHSCSSAAVMVASAAAACASAETTPQKSS